MTAITIWPSVEQPRAGRRIAATHDDLVAQIRRRAQLAPTSEVWSPAEYRDDRRALGHVECVHALVLDYDEGDVDPRRLWSGYAGVIHTTRHHNRAKGDKPACARYRAILVPSRPMNTTTEHKAIAAWAATQGGTLDHCSLTASQPWYWPSVDAEVHELGGAPLDVDAILERHVNGSARATATTPASSGRVDRLLAKSDWLRERWEGGGRRKDDTDYPSRSERDFAVARFLISNGVCIESAVAAMRTRGGDERTDERYVARTVSGAADTAGDEPPRCDRPVIRTGVDLHRVVDDAVMALAHDGDLYQRDGQLVHVVCPVEPDDYLPAGTPQLRGVPNAALRERLTRVTDWERYDGRTGDWRACLPSDAVVTALAVRGEWPAVRALVGVLEAPSLRPDGTVIQVAGYDKATGWLHRPSCAYPAVRDAPTQADASEALRALREVWCDFPWASAAEAYVPLAAVLALLARPAIRGAVPAHVFDASTRGSGKTLIADVIATLVTGRDAPRKSWPERDEEIEKVLGAYALRGARLIAWDNVHTVFGGGPLDAVLTATDRVELRVLGRSEVATLRWRAVTLAGGNNVQLGADTTRRCLVARLEPDVERPEERTGYRHPDLVGWVRAERPRLVCAALTILRGHAVAGRPDMGIQRWGSFDDWRAIVAAAIVWAGGADVIGCRASGDGERDPEAGALAVVLAELPRLGPDGCTARTVAECLWPGGRMRSAHHAPDGWDPLRDALEQVIRCRPGTAPTARQIGTRLRSWRGRVARSCRLVSAPNRERTAVWSVARVR